MIFSGVKTQSFDKLTKEQQQAYFAQADLRGVTLGKQSLSLKDVANRQNSLNQTASSELKKQMSYITEFSNIEQHELTDNLDIYTDMVRYSNLSQQQIKTQTRDTLIQFRTENSAEKEKAEQKLMEYQDKYDELSNKDYSSVDLSEEQKKIVYNAAQKIIYDRENPSYNQIIFNGGKINGNSYIPAANQQFNNKQSLNLHQFIQQQKAKLDAVALPMIESAKTYKVKDLKQLDKKQLQQYGRLSQSAAETANRADERSSQIMDLYDSI